MRSATKHKVKDEKVSACILFVRNLITLVKVCACATSQPHVRRQRSELHACDKHILGHRTKSLLPHSTVRCQAYAPTPRSTACGITPSIHKSSIACATILYRGFRDSRQHLNCVRPRRRGEELVRLRAPWLRGREHEGRGHGGALGLLGWSGALKTSSELWAHASAFLLRTFEDFKRIFRGF